MAANGRLNTAELVDVGGGKLLRADAARAWVALVNAAFAATGIRLTLTEGYRTYARQVYLYALYKSGLGNVAAKPGTSNHGLGVAVDMGNYGSVRMWAWLLSNAPRYGWSWAQGKASGEAWHWVYVGGATNTTPASTTTTTPITAEQEAIMAVPFDLIVDSDSKPTAAYVVVANNIEHVGGLEWEALNLLKAALVENAETNTPPANGKRLTSGQLANAANALQRASKNADKITPKPQY